MNTPKRFYKEVNEKRAEDEKILLKHVLACRVSLSSYVVSFRIALAKRNERITLRLKKA